MWDLRQDTKYTNYLRKLGWFVDELKKNYLYTIKLPLIRLAITKIQRPQELVQINELYKIVKKRKSFLVYVEPKDKYQYSYYRKMGFKKSHTPSLPTKTVRINLKKDTKQLLQSMHHKTRYNIGLAKRKGVKISFSQDIDTFVHLWQESARLRGMYFSQSREIRVIYEAFGKDAYILYAYKEDVKIAGVLLLISKNISYYMYAFSTAQGKKYFAPSLLVWESIVFSKSKKVDYFDFEGVFDDRYPLKSWRGFTKFKLSFGGEIIEFPAILWQWFIPGKFLS